jgi:hypothetical protein
MWHLFLNCSICAQTSTQTFLKEMSGTGRDFNPAAAGPSLAGIDFWPFAMSINSPFHLTLSLTPSK